MVSKFCRNNKELISGEEEAKDGDQNMRVTSGYMKKIKSGQHVFPCLPFIELVLGARQGVDNTV